MAEAMENAMKIEYKAANDDKEMPSMGADDRKILFAAIAQGVVRHLKDNLDAFKVDTTLTGLGGGSADSSIDSLTTEGTLHP